MDYSSQDSIPIDFSRNNKIDMMHGHLTNVMMEEDMLERRNNVILVRSYSLMFCASSSTNIGSDHAEPRRE